MPLSGTRLGPYEIIAPLGAGGMGEVFLAEDTRLKRRVAVKLLPASAETDAVARERLRREALAAAALDHPFICKVYEIGEADGRLFIAMEYVEGETLHVAVHRALLPLRQVLDLAHELAQALDAAHRRGIVHRDLKPANVMVTPQAHVKVMDFGLAQVIASSQTRDGADVGTAGATAARLTSVGTRLGTPAYMSPEQVLGAALDPRSDIFSLGVILHELATGRHPFLRDDPAATMAAILRDPPMAGSRDAEEVVGFSAVIGRMLAKACAERHQTTGALLEDLEALRARAWSSSARAAPAGPAVRAERTPFVGRDSEAAELARALDGMLTGQGGLVLVGGEPGVGKTRLGRELLATARQRGCLSLTGHCYEMEGAAPFVPFVEIIEQTVRLVPQAARAAMGEFAPEIAAMVPSLRRVYGDIPALPEVPADQQRRLIFSAFLDYARRGSQKSPAVFLVDDLHWADEPTLQLLLHLAPHLASMRVLIVGTYRDVELDVNRGFAQALESLLRQRLATRIALRRLNESGVRQMLSKMSGSAPPSGLATAVFRETEGNPFFIEEVYQHLSEEGKLFDASGAWKADLRVDTIEVPEGVRLVIGRRLERLGEPTRKVLTAAAVIGRTFPLDVLQAVAGLSEDAVLDAVEQSERAQLVAPDASQRLARYGFVHELIRTTLVAGLSLPRRQRLHLKIADALERLRAGSLESHASVLAHHLYQAGAAADTGRTATFLLLAGRRALVAGAFEETLESLDHLLALELPEDDPRLGEACEHRAEALAGVQRHDDAIDAFDRALAIYGACGDDAGIERAARGGANVRLWRGRVADALAPLTRGLRALSKDATRERALLLAWSGRSSLGHIDEAWQHLDEATALAKQGADPAVSRRVLIAKSFVQFYCASQDGAATAREALSLIPAEALWDRADVLALLATCEVNVCRFAACDELLPQLERVARRAGHHGALYLHDITQHSIEAARTGHIRPYLAWANAAMDRPIMRNLTPSFVGTLSLYLGASDEAFGHLRTAAEQPADTMFYPGAPAASLLAATALCGEHDRARGMIPAVVPWLPAAGHRHWRGAYYALEGFITGLALLGDRDQCGALYAVTRDYIRTGQVFTYVIVGPSTPHLAAALAADAAGLAAPSRDHFETALRQAREVPVRILQPTVLYWYGRALSAASDGADRSRGRAMVEAALTDFRALEMVLHAQLAEQFLREGR